MAIREKQSRTDLVVQLRARDGDLCQHPDCGQPLIFDTREGKQSATIDHWLPQWYGRENGWTAEEIWALDNLKLMHKKCNAKKGDVIPNEDGTLPERVTRTFRYRRDKRSQRPEICTSCESGRKLGPTEVCASCGSGPMPERFPRWAKVPFPDCDHELFWCWSCSIGITPRVGATEMIMFGGEGGLDDSE